MVNLGNLGDTLMTLGGHSAVTLGGTLCDLGGQVWSTWVSLRCTLVTLGGTLCDFGVRSGQLG